MQPSIGGYLSPLFGFPAASIRSDEMQLIEKTALLGGVNMLLEPNEFSIVESPHVRDLNFSWLG
jgi:hypothetical protein